MLADAARHSDAKVAKLYLDMEKLVESGQLLDLRTLNEIHERWEFDFDTESEFDAWLHAHITKARRAKRQRGGGKL